MTTNSTPETAEARDARYLAEYETCECPSCRSNAHRIRTGQWPTWDARGNAAMMWGCTGTPEAEADAIAYFDLVTR